MESPQIPILEMRERDPFAYLGMHSTDKGLVVRAYFPGARKVHIRELAPKGMRLSLECVDPEGFFELEITDRDQWFAYEFEVEYDAGNVIQLRDPYSFQPVMSDFDLHLFGEGKHYRIYEKLGSHVMQLDGVDGVFFATWAPNAGRIGVVGDFNQWDGRRHLMRTRGSSGVWELFIPGLGPGTVYKFEIRYPNGDVVAKSDPYAFHFERRPNNASIVWQLGRHEWGDAEYMDRRRQRNWLREPTSIYEVHLGSWVTSLERGDPLPNYRELAPRLAAHAKGLGFTHIELLPVAEHPLDESWGYQVSGYFAPTSRFGTPEDFQFFVDTMHQAGIGVILDWVPGHFPRDEHGLAWFDGTALYEHADPRQGEHKEWGTKIFNFARHEVSNFLLANALFWLEQYHIDGLRVDAVASMLYLDYNRPEGEWLANRFGGRENIEAIECLKQLNVLVHEQFPGAVTIAEESTSWPAVSRPVYLGGLGFSLKWNMGWMHDILSFFGKDPFYRKYHIEYLTFALLYAFHENFALPLSHDEVVHGKRSLLSKMPGDVWQQFANLRLLYGYMYGQPGKKLIFMGGEFAQWNEWYCKTSLDWQLAEYRPHWAMMRYVARLNELHRDEPALHELDFEPAGFEWIDFRDTDNCAVSFVRWAHERTDHVVCVFNTTPVPRHQYRIGVPRHTFYHEILNSDADCYWGSNQGNLGGVHSQPEPAHGQPCSIEITLPPLGALYFKPEAP